MGEAQNWLFEPSFNRSIKVRERSERLTSDAGVLLLREADHRLALSNHWPGGRPSLGDRGTIGAGAISPNLTRPVRAG